MGEDRIDFGIEPPVSYTFAYSMFFGAVSVMVFLWWVFESDPVHHPVVRFD